MLRNDASQRHVVHTDSVSWQPSPAPGVTRKRLERSGPKEAGRVTSIVCYAPGSAFHRHPHPDGEEILVLSGIFSDDRGDHPAGTMLLNPEGFSHAPGSAGGCTLFVKLRQYGGPGRPQAAIDTHTMPWQPHSTLPGISIKRLYCQPDRPEQIHLVRLAPGTTVGAVGFVGGVEVLVLSGDLSDGHGHYRTHTWIRDPTGTQHAPATQGGCTLYVKTGHLSR
ncbi:MAG: cupin domain-containing protein [Myxococcota bacterium]|nr:cupin domain-containing protein [Myxococcota bacterium]